MSGGSDDGEVVPPQASDPTEEMDRAVPLSRRRRRWPIVVGALVAAALVGIGLGIAVQRSTADTDERLAAHYGGSSYFVERASQQADLTVGDTVFPVGVWDGGPGEAELWRSAGITFYAGQLYYDPAAVDAAEQAGLKVVGFEGSVDDDASPALVGWRPRLVNGTDNTWDDEPDLFKPDIGACVPPATFDAHVKALKEQDPERLTLVNLGFTPLQELGYFEFNRGPGCDGETDDFAEYTAHADLVSSDVYPRSTFDEGRPLPLTVVGDLVTQTRAAVGEKPVCALIEASDIDGDGTAIRAGELRFTVLHSIVRGAACVIYFTLDSSYDNPKKILDTPELLTAMTAVNGVLAADAAAFNSPSVEGAVEADDATGVEWVVKRTPDDDLVVVVVETAGEARDVALRVEGVDEGVVTARLGEAPPAVCDGQLDLSLDAYGAAVVRIDRDGEGAGCASSS